MNQTGKYIITIHDSFIVINYLLSNGVEIHLVDVTHQTFKIIRDTMDLIKSNPDYSKLT